MPNLPLRNAVHRSKGVKDIRLIKVNSFTNFISFSSIIKIKDKVATQLDYNNKSKAANFFLLHLDDKSKQNYLKNILKD